MKCGKCGTQMRNRTDVELGLEIRVHACPKCGKRLIDWADAERLQQRALSRIEDVRTVLVMGNSIGITLPARLKKILKRGDKVRFVWDAEAREARVAKA